MKLVRAIHDAPSILDRFSYGRERFILKVRIMADLEDRIGEEMRRVRCETALFEA
jgi:hypothetical protein